MKTKFVIFLVTGIIAILLVLFYIFFFNNIFVKAIPMNFIDVNKTTVGINQINLILYNIKAYELHNPPFSSNTPKIEFVIEDEIYNTEIVKGKIITKKEGIENPDLKIIMPKEEFLFILNSNDLKKSLQDSVSNGNTKIEILAGNTELFVKGYLSLYQEITGKSLTGNVIKIFSTS